MSIHYSFFKRILRSRLLKYLKLDAIYSLILYTKVDKVTSPILHFIVMPATATLQVLKEKH